jgi:hypothetical protein
MGVICLFNVFLGLKSDSVPKLIMRQMRATPRIDILFLGNSLMESGFDSNSFASAWPASTSVPYTFNAGLGSSSPVEHFLLAHQAYLHHQSIPYVVYGFYDLQLTKPQGFGWGDLVGNRSMGYSTEPSTAASLYAPGSMLEKWRFYLIGAVPMLREHSKLWQYIEILRRSIQELGMPHLKTNQFGRVADFKAIAMPEQVKFARDCEVAVKDSIPFVSAVQELLRLAHEKNTELIVVEMPMDSAHRNSYYSTVAWQKYQTYLKQRLEGKGITYVIASDWVSNDGDFSDGLHLNKMGANIYSAKMAQFMANKLKQE